MKFLSLAQLFGDRKSRSAASGKRISSRVGKKRRSGSLPLYLETLEDRSLLSTVPAPVVALNTTLGVSATTGTGGASAPSTAVDPIDSQKLVTVYTDDGLGTTGAEPIQLRGAFSNDGGDTWTNFTLPGNLTDPTVVPPAPPIPLPDTTDGTVAWDGSGNFYVTYSEHKADSSAGYILLAKYQFTSAAPLNKVANSVVYAWDGSDTVFHPYVAVDSNNVLDPALSVVDPNAGNVYVAWSTVDTSPTGFVSFNPNSVKELVSSNGGATFGPYKYLNTNAFDGGTGTPAVTLPSIAVSAGGTKGVAPGQVTTVFDDFNSDNGTPADAIEVALMQKTTFGQGFVSTGGPVGDAICLRIERANPDIPVTTTYTQTVSGLPGTILESQFNLGLDLIHPSLNELLITVTAPTGKTFTLLENGENPDGSTNAGIGISGANLGVTANGSTLGTFFDSTAPRSIQDTSATAPFIGHYDPEGSFLTFPTGTLLSALNGVWTLKITDMKSESGAGATPPVQRLVDWNVSLAGGFTTTVKTVGTTPIRGAVNAPYPLLTTASPAFGVGPAPVIAADNTLGATSSTKGNLYVAFVSRLSTIGTSNQADNTDIVLFVSTNGGLSWVEGPADQDGLPIPNNDYTDNDGFSEAAIDASGAFIQGCRGLHRNLLSTSLPVPSLPLGTMAATTQLARGSRALSALAPTAARRSHRPI